MTGSYKFWPWGSETEGLHAVLGLSVSRYGILDPPRAFCSVVTAETHIHVDQIDQHTGENKKNMSRNRSRNRSRNKSRNKNRNRSRNCS